MVTTTGIEIRVGQIVRVSTGRDQCHDQDDGDDDPSSGSRQPSGAELTMTIALQDRVIR